MNRLGAGLAAIAIGLAACSGLPDAECPPPSQMPVSCSDAVNLAVAQLASDHPAVARVQVVRGDFRPVMFGGSLVHVVFTYSGGVRVAVPVYQFEPNGEVTAGEPRTH
jgi:hypothetical protein